LQFEVSEPLHFSYECSHYSLGVVMELWYSIYFPHKNLRDSYLTGICNIIEGVLI
jgi:hypothetical protein